ncbi:MAG TPA: hypothetical protein VGE41_03540 [Verrucomicrobiae bacterium]
MSEVILAAFALTSFDEFNCQVSSVFSFQEGDKDDMRIRIKKKIKSKRKGRKGRFSRFAGVFGYMHMFGICVSTVSTVKKGRKRRIWTFIRSSIPYLYGWDGKNVPPAPLPKKDENILMELFEP